VDIKLTERFVGDEKNAKKCERPTNLCDALASLPQDELGIIGIELFGYMPEHDEYPSIEEMLELVYGLKKADTFPSSMPFVRVWLGEDGSHTVDVYKEGEY